MKFHPDPTPVTPSKLDRESLAFDFRVKAWTKRVLDGEPIDDAMLGDETTPKLTEEQLLFVCSEVEKRFIVDRRDRHHIERAVAKTAPLIAQPDLNRPLEDIELLFALPEMREWWADVERLREMSSPVQSSGFKANYAGTLAAMTRMAIRGSSAHVDDNLQDLSRDTRMRAFFGWVHESATSGAGSRSITDGSSVDVPSETRFSELAPRMAQAVIVACKHTNMVMLRELEALLHDEGRLPRSDSVLDDLMTDGTDVPAWVKQRGGGGKGTPRDLRMRRDVPEGGYRAYARASGRGGGGKVDVTAKTKLTGRGLANNIFKDWRGYYLNILASTRLQLPAQATSFDAAENEPTGLVPLLSDVHRYGDDADWDFDVKRLTADSAYDTANTVKLCAVNYGIDPVFVRDTSKDKDEPFHFTTNASQSETLKARTAQGQLMCSTHERLLRFDSAVKPTREKNGRPLRPGQPTNEDRFRIRGISDCCGRREAGVVTPGRPSIRMREDWRRLTAIPHYADGAAGKHALRTALQVRLNGIEMIHSRLKIGHKLALGGAARTRIRDKDVVEALIQIALMSMTAAALVDRRLRNGLPLDPAGIPADIEVPDAAAQVAAATERLERLAA